MSKSVALADVEQNFARYRETALVEPVIVTQPGEPAVVILAAREYDRLKKLDREVLAITELSEADIAAIEQAEISEEHRYHSDDLPK
jgi:antitoxin StbD